jgi:hypothetical protein
LCHIHVDRYDDQDVTNPGINKSNERWIVLDSDLISNRQGQVTETCNSTGHSILICTHIELPSYLTEEESKELTAKLEILHEILDKEVRITNTFLSFFFFFFCSLAFCRFHLSYDYLILYIFSKLNVVDRLQNVDTIRRLKITKEDKKKKKF